MSEHTPGPWHWLDTDKEDQRVTRILVAGGGRVAILYHDAAWPIDDGDVRLIAAAPALFDALIASQRLLTAMYAEYVAMDLEVPTVKAAIEANEAALQQTRSK